MNVLFVKPHLLIILMSPSVDDDGKCLNVIPKAEGWTSATWQAFCIPGSRAHSKQIGYRVIT